MATAQVVTWHWPEAVHVAPVAFGGRGLVQSVHAPPPVPHAVGELLQGPVGEAQQPFAQVVASHWHSPLMQAVPGLHANPHAPQLFGSDARLTQTAPQSTSGAAHVAPPSSGAKPTPTFAWPFGCSVSDTLVTCWATSVAPAGSLIHVAWVLDVTPAHADGYASPTNVSAPSGRPISFKTAEVPGVTSERLVTVRAPVTSISTHPTIGGTAVIAAVA